MSISRLGLGQAHRNEYDPNRRNAVPRYHIPLGSARAQKQGVGIRGRALDMASKRGIPVPKGYILLDKAYHTAWENDLLALEDNTIFTRNPASLVTSLHLPKLDGSLVVRPAFDHPADTFSRIENVNNLHELGLAFTAVWSSALSQKGDFRRDILVTQVVPEVHASGTAELMDDYDCVTDEDGQTRKLQHLRWWQSGERLQYLLRRTRRVTGTARIIRWDDDGKRCWLVEVMGGFYDPPSL